MIVKYGSTGELVKILQELLSIEVDGIFGDATRKSLIYFQKKINYNQMVLQGHLLGKN